MKRSQSSNQQPKPSQSIKKDTLQKVVVIKKTQAIDIATVMIGSSSTVESTAEKVPPAVQQVAPAMVNDGPLREFLLAADIHAQQTFLAHVAMLAVKDAQHQAVLQITSLRNQNTVFIKTKELIQQQLAEQQKQYQKLLSEHTKVQQQLAQQQVGLQRITDQYQTLLEDNHHLNTDLKRQADEAEKDAVWTDPKTGLMWSRVSIGQIWSKKGITGVAQKLTWKRAQESCQSLVLAGSNDWRLPEKSELESLIRKEEKTTSWGSSSINHFFSSMSAVLGSITAGYSTSDGVLFPPKENEFGGYWSQTNLTHKELWSVNFDDGQVSAHGKRSSFYVRAVRNAN